MSRVLGMKDAALAHLVEADEGGVAPPGGVAHEDV